MKGYNRGMRLLALLTLLAAVNAYALEDAGSASDAQGLGSLVDTPAPADDAVDATDAAAEAEVAEPKFGFPTPMLVAEPANYVSGDIVFHPPPRPDDAKSGCSGAKVTQGVTLAPLGLASLLFALLGLRRERLP